MFRPYTWAIFRLSNFESVEVLMPRGWGGGKRDLVFTLHVSGSWVVM
jgi:hypothetical protein